MAEITIAICTYKRAEIQQTLASIANQVLPEDVYIRVIVADNDVEPTMRQLIEETAKSIGIKLTYIHAPSRNISIARNACLINCETQWLVFIDDDETASNMWLSELYKTALNENADVVLGPVISVYPSNAPNWIVKCDFHSTKPVFVNGVIETGYTGNTLLKLSSEFFENEMFNLSLGKSGGEDTDYLSRAFKKGAKLAFAENAIVHEPVPSERATLNWLIKRKFRVGQTYALTLFNATSSKIFIAQLMFKAFSKFTFCLIMMVLFCLHPVKRYNWLLRGCLHFGVVTKLFGVKNIELY